MQLEFSRFVESDLDAIADYIAQDNPHRAITFIQEIRARFHAIRHRPLLYQLRPDIGKEARMATLGNYAILFLNLTGDVVFVQALIISLVTFAAPQEMPAPACLCTHRAVS